MRTNDDRFQALFGSFDAGEQIAGRVDLRLKARGTEFLRQPAPSLEKERREGAPCPRSLGIRYARQRLEALPQPVGVYLHQCRAAAPGRKRPSPALLQMREPSHTAFPRT